MRILGVDGGLTSAAAAVIEVSSTKKPKLLDVIDIPIFGSGAQKRIDGREFWRWVDGLRPERAYIERAQAFKNQGASSGFAYGRAVGALENTVDLMFIPWKLVEAASWKRAFRLSGGDKRASIVFAQRALVAGPRLLTLVKDHNKAEAALIALYGSGAAFRRG